MAGHIFHRVVNSAKSRVIAATTVISKQIREYNDIEGLGSGILLKLNGDIFLITAAHLLNHENWHLLTIPGENNSLITLQGELHSSYLTQENGSNIDFSILKFYPKMHKYLSRYAPFTEHEIMVNHSAVSGDNYLVCGFPFRKIKKEINEGVIIYTASPLILLTYNVSPKRYQKNNFSPDTHMLVQFQQKLQAFGSEVFTRAANPAGVSGSGLYFIPAFDEAHVINPRVSVIGIMIENHKDRGFMVAMRIEPIIEVIRNTFLDQNLNLDHPKQKFHAGAIYKGDYTTNQHLSEQGEKSAPIEE